MNQKLKFAAAALGGIVATVAAGGIAFAAMDDGLGKLRGTDVNGDGTITRAEWIQTTVTRFDALDTNKDGKLAVGEIPARGGRDGGGKRGHGRHGRDADWDRPAPPPAAAAAAPAPAAPATAPTPAPAK